MSILVKLFPVLSKLKEDGRLAVAGDVVFKNWCQRSLQLLLVEF